MAKLMRRGPGCPERASQAGWSAKDAGAGCSVNDSAAIEEQRPLRII